MTSKIKYAVSVEVRYRHRLDLLVRQCTAFGSLYDMAESMDTGYVPTLSGLGTNAIKLARELQELGFTVHTRDSTKTTVLRA